MTAMKAGKPMKARKAMKSTTTIRWRIPARSERLAEEFSMHSAQVSWDSAIADEIRQLHRAGEGKKAALADLRRLPVANSRREKL